MFTVYAEQSIVIYLRMLVQVKLSPCTSQNIKDNLEYIEIKRNVPVQRKSIPANIDVASFPDTSADIFSWLLKGIDE